MKRLVFVGALVSAFAVSTAFAQTAQTAEKPARKARAGSDTQGSGHAAPQADLEVMYVLHERPAVRHVVVAENLKFQALERVADVGRIVDGIRERIAFHVIRITDDQRHTAHFRWLRAAHMLARARLGGGVHDDGSRGCRQEDQRKRRKRKARTSALPAPSQQLPRHKINC